MKFAVVREIEPNTGDIKREFEVDLDDEFFAVYMDSLFSWARRGAKDSPQVPFKSHNPEDDYKDVNSKILFGKHRGKTWGDVLKEEPDYVEWVMNNVDRVPDTFKRYMKSLLPAKSVPEQEF